ncbi:MAG: RNA methyltransferase [Caldilineaceae bacterium]
MITSTDNPQIKEARKLQRRRQRHKSQSLLLEGVRLIRDALQSNAHIDTIFFAPDLVQANSGAQNLLAALMQHSIPCQPCTIEVFKSLTETQTPQGVAAITALPTLPLPNEATLVLILDQVRDPGNAGTLLRTAEAAGANFVIFGPDTVDPFNDKVVRAGMGAHFRLPLRICTDWSQIATLLPPSVTCYMAQADAKRVYDAIDWTAPAALVIGGEAAGASRDAYLHAAPLAIPMHGPVESLNAAVAGAVILFEASRQRRYA